MNPRVDQPKNGDISVIFRRLEVATPIQLEGFFGELFEAKGFDGYETLKEVVNYLPRIENSFDKSHRLIQFLFNKVRGLLLRLTKIQRDELMVWCEKEYYATTSKTGKYLYTEIGKSIHAINDQISQGNVAGVDEVIESENSPESTGVRKLVGIILEQVTKEEFKGEQELVKRREVAYQTRIFDLFRFINSLNQGDNVRNIDVLLTSLEQVDGVNPSNLAIKYILDALKNNFAKSNFEQNLAVRERIRNYVESQSKAKPGSFSTRYQSEVFGELLKELDSILNPQEETKPIEVRLESENPVVPPMAPPTMIPPFTNRKPGGSQMPPPPSIPPKPNKSI